MTGKSATAEPEPEVVAEEPVVEDPAAEPTSQPEVNITFPEDGDDHNSNFVPSMRGPGQNVYQNNDINSAVVGEEVIPLVTSKITPLRILRTSSAFKKSLDERLLQSGGE